MSTWKTAGQTEEVERGYGDPMQDPRYAELLKRLQTIHAELLKTELKVENPALIGDTLGELRLGANQLFAFLNYYIDALSDLELPTPRNDKPYSLNAWLYQNRVPAAVRAMLVK